MSVLVAWLKRDLLGWPRWYWYVGMTMWIVGAIIIGRAVR